MSPNSETLRSPSLAQHFAAPKDYAGHFGWLCGYSADAIFLDDAAERFTRLTRSHRALLGSIALTVLLDPGNPPVSLLDVPGVAHLPIMDHANMPFRLLHAKVALLGFRHLENNSQWQLRLLVSTGNWTRQTLEESLDLVWRIDIDSESLNHPDANIKQDCADIKAAWNLLVWIQNLFDTRLLNASANGHLSATMNSLQRVRQWIDASSKKAYGRSRVFDNRKNSLLYQLPTKIKACGDVKRNYLAMGSGFYEASVEHDKSPKVPVAIVKSLLDESLLTKKPEVDLYVNPMACQSISTSVQPLQNCGIKIRPAAIPQFVFGEGAQRALHAKFLFSAVRRSNAYSSAWVYLGSGNLTHPGFANKISASAGNLEAGVVFAPNKLFREKQKGAEDHQVVTNLLPIQWAVEIGEVAQISAGSGMEPRDSIYVAPPVAWLTWHEADDVRELRTDELSVSDFQVIDSAGIACSKTQTGIIWCESQPRQVRLQWQENGKSFESLIPVVDQYGRIAATELRAINIDEAWWQLDNFPMPPDEDGGCDGDGRGDESDDKGEMNGSSVPTTSYPIRQMMELIESIASKQIRVDEMDWVLWCNRLEQTLGQTGSSTPVKYFRDELKLNPLSPLRHKSFRPSFAENGDSELVALFDDTLCRIEVSWKVDKLSPIGGPK